MAIHYVVGRSFTGAFEPPQYIVLGEEGGCVFRRVYRTQSLAERFKNKMIDRGARNVVVAPLGRKNK